MQADNYQRDQVVESERQLVDLYEPLLNILTAQGQEQHERIDTQQEHVYWQTPPVILDEDGELPIVTLRTVAASPDRDLNNPHRRVEFFEKRDLQLDVEGPQGLERRLLVGRWGEGAVLLGFKDGAQIQVPLTRSRFDYYLRLASTLREIISAS
jgi:hypothetical protein